ncbi:hypothetical protein ES288_A07G156500v1 [Gossypium darwinii]|uniref:Uncharacterized protein n=2 Tax=Gossypium TaxID=3633 RepID=A0A5D2PTC8_GOSTO|nr:hypothetical protein ES288_A07G156500v1 [Gossypium darwinii]TYI19306.1 hypothetical protein ES332_A07G156200v1 [Gossypium tomentosum]
MGLRLRALQTALLHLKPDPNAICHTLSPLDTRPLASVVILEGSICQSVSCKFFCNSSKTALPPAWIQKCSKASLKSGMYGLTLALKIFFRTRVTKNMNCSVQGKTRGPRVVILVFNASPATAISSRANETPTVPFSSSLCWYLERLLSPALFDKSTAAPPMRNMQLHSNMDLSLPKYQFSVMFSVLTTTAYVLGLA